MATNVPQGSGKPVEYVDDDAIPETDDAGGVATLDEEPKVENAYDFGDPAEDEVEPTPEPNTVAKDGGEKAKDMAEQQEQPEIDSGLNDLLGRAEEYGFSKEFVEKLGPEATVLAMAAVDRQLSAIGRQGWEANKPVEKQPDKQPEKDPEKPAQSNESSLRLNEEEVDPTIVKFSGDVEARFARLEQELNAVKAENEKLRQPVQRSQEREASELESKLDSLFDKSGDAELFGKGAFREMPQASTTAKARMDVWIEMNAIQAGRKATGRPELSLEEAHTRAVNSLYPDKIKIQARKEVETKLAKRKASGIAKPTSRVGKPLSRLEAAASFVERMFKEHNIETAVDDDGEV